jgi:penicillin-binding protein 2
MQSCDMFFYSIAAEIGINRIAEYARMLGLGSRLGIELPEEKPGLVPTREWKLAHFNRGWLQGETVIAGIGQGYLETTPLQLTVMTARLCNGGYAVKPWVTASLGGTPMRAPQWPKIPVADKHLKLIRRGMEQVVASPRGTGHGSRILAPGLQMAGKSGTAQVRRITMKQRAEGIRNEDLPWLYRHHALFVSYAPVDNPRYACCVVVEHGGGGGESAAPIARDLMEMVQRRDPARAAIVPGKIVEAEPPLPALAGSPPAGQAREE